MPSELKYQDKNLLEGDLRSENCNGLDSIVSVLLFVLSAVPFRKKTSSNVHHVNAPLTVNPIL